MHADDPVAEARRLLRLCAACMYCDDLCPVFPAIAGRHAFSAADLAYVGNLCHSCKACHYACQYAPPHAFAVNLPRSLARVRQISYADYARPRFLRGAFAGGFPRVSTALVAVAVAAFEFLRAGAAGHAGSIGFYDIIPERWMLLSMLGALLAAAASLAWSACAFWADIGPSAGLREILRAAPRAISESIALTHLGGDGPGCADGPDLAPQGRRWAHHLLVAGLATDFSASIAAAFSEHWLGMAPPFPASSAPVVLGVAGGALVLGGVCSLVWLKRRADPEPVAAETAGADYQLLGMIALVVVSGAALLAARSTTAMPWLLALHLGLVGSFFALLPASKFVHAIYRSAALLRATVESRARAGGRTPTDLAAGG